MHSAGALTSAPLWVMAVVALAFTLGLSSGHLQLKNGGRQRLQLACVAALGFAAVTMLPHDVPAPRGPVVTHAVWGAHADEDLFAALEILDDHPERLLGKRISVTGFWHEPEPGARAAVSRPIMACCAADAVDVGFDVVFARSVRAQAMAKVRVTGIVTASLASGETRYVLVDASVAVLSARSSVAK